jgi:hypothetical protein
MPEPSTTFTPTNSAAQLKAAMAEPALAAAEVYVDAETGWGATIDPGDGEALLEVVGFETREQLRAYLGKAEIGEIVDDQADRTEDDDEAGESDLA